MRSLGLHSLPLGTQIWGSASQPKQTSPAELALGPHRATTGLNTAVGADFHTLLLQTRTQEGPISRHRRTHPRCQPLALRTGLRRVTASQPEQYYRFQASSLQNM